MFLVNSRLGLFTATLSRSISKLLHGTRVPLLPKLRGDFAEFLSESCLALLRIFFLPTCGGLRYGLSTISNAKFFLAIWNQHLLVRRLSTSRLTLNELVDFPASSGYTLIQSLPIDCVFILLRPSAIDNDYY